MKSHNDNLVNVTKYRHIVAAQCSSSKSESLSAYTDYLTTPLIYGYSFLGLLSTNRHDFAPELPIS